MSARTDLLHGIEALGELLKAKGQAHDLVVIGGAALLLLGVIDRPTLDIDVVALANGDLLSSARPLPPDLVEAVRDIGQTLGLPIAPVQGKDWLNAGPSFLLELGLPPGFSERLQQRTFTR